jgi:hypothetical protein
VFHVIAGYGRRARGTSLTENFVGYGRAGAGTAIGLGSSGIMLEVAGGALFGARSNLSDIASVGREGEVSVFYQLPRGLPLFAQLGYRYQWFKNRDRAGTSSEETSALVLGVGLRHLKLPTAKP